MRRYGWLVIGIVLLGLWAWSQRATAPVGASPPTATTQQPHAPLSAPDAMPAQGDAAATRYPSYLPREALAMLRLIENGGPFAHRQDGGTFQNREHQLPSQPRGYYREYTVETPGSRDRGARRIIAGGDPPVEFFYTDDHYRSFRRFARASTADAR
jgi:guanyl-specific ribonuclease Sa